MGRVETVGSRQGGPRSLGCLPGKGSWNSGRQKGQGTGKAEGPGRKTRSRETARRTVNTLWEGVNNELRTPLTPPAPEMLFLGERIYAVQGSGGRLPSSSGVSQLCAAPTFPTIFLSLNTFCYIFLPWKIKIFFPDLSWGGMSSEVWSWPLITFLEDPCGVETGHSSSG